MDHKNNKNTGFVRLDHQSHFQPEEVGNEELVSAIEVLFRVSLLIVFPLVGMMGGFAWKNNSHGSDFNSQLVAGVVCGAIGFIAFIVVGTIAFSDKYSLREQFKAWTD